LPNQQQKTMKETYIITIKGIFPTTRKQSADLESGIRSFEFTGTEEELSDELKRISKDEASSKVIGVMNKNEVLVEFKPIKEEDPIRSFVEVINCFAPSERFTIEKSDLYKLFPDHANNILLGLNQNGFSRVMIKLALIEKLKAGTK